MEATSHSTKLLTVDQAATYLSVSPLTVYDWIGKRKIEYVKVGRLVRFREHTLEKWIEKQTVKPIHHQAATA